MKNIPTELLRTYVTVVELDGFTQAAELLGRTQPAISLQIKRLETLLGQTLLVRLGQRVEQSHSGKTIYSYAKRILALNDEALTQFMTTAVKGNVHFGVPSEFATTILPKIVRHFSEAYPDISLEVTSALSQELLERQKSREYGNYDLILASHYAPIDGGELIKNDDLVWLSSENHDVHLQDPLPLIVAPDGCRYRERAIEVLNANNRAFRIVYTNSDIGGIEAALNEGLGVTVLTKSTAPEHLRQLRPSDKLPKLGTIGISLISQSQGVNKATQYLIDYVKASLS
ncbi:MAG: DNA-binding transcriptional LysR family regulator [Candidatus Endobugula sp.]|jgi:DNA-binding transcriptional LysR family regulator